jgi:hypothetical protein
MMKLDLIAANKYNFPIEDQVLSVNIGGYHMEQIVEHNEKIDITKRAYNPDGTCNIYALVEAGEQYLVHTPEKSQQLRIGPGGEVVYLHTQYRKPG